MIMYGTIKCVYYNEGAREMRKQREKMCVCVYLRVYVCVYLRVCYTVCQGLWPS